MLCFIVYRMEINKNKCSCQLNSDQKYTQNYANGGGGGDGVMGVRTVGSDQRHPFLFWHVLNSSNVHYRIRQLFFKFLFIIFRHVLCEKIGCCGGRVSRRDGVRGGWCQGGDDQWVGRWG